MYEDHSDIINNLLAFWTLDEIKILEEWRDKAELVKKGRK